MTTCYGELVNDVQRQPATRYPRRGRPLTDLEAATIRAAQEAIDRAQDELDRLLGVRNELFRRLHADGVMPVVLARAAVTAEHPDGLHRTVVARQIPGAR